jgi:hypothetical protein
MNTFRPRSIPCYVPADFFLDNFSSLFPESPSRGSSPSAARYFVGGGGGGAEEKPWGWDEDRRVGRDRERGCVRGNPDGIIIFFAFFFAQAACRALVSFFLPSFLFKA